MKKLFCAMMVVLMSVGFSGCFSSFYNASTKDEYEQEQGQEYEQDQKQKVYGVGDTQKLEGVSLTVTNVESGVYCGSSESENGSFVKVSFKMKNENNEPHEISYLDFTLNDTYTIRETTYRMTNIEIGGFELLKGNEYEFYAIFDCKYEHTQVDMIFGWEKGLFDGTKEWVL